MFHVVLYEPEIPPNTGNIMRLCANSGAQLHLIEPLGFDLDEKKVRRAGMDYRDLMQVTTHASLDDCLATLTGRVFACTTKAARQYASVIYQPDDVLLFGPETRGLPEAVINALPETQHVRIPMLANSRSLNLANAVSIILYEALRQQDFAGLQ